MIPLLLVYFAATLLYLSMGAYAYAVNPGAQANRILLLISFLLAYWTFSILLMTAAPTEELASFWLEFSTFGWTIVPGAILHFALALTGHHTLLRRWWIYPLIYGPGFVLAYANFSTAFIVDQLFQEPWGWTYTRDVGAPWYLTFTLYYLGTVLLACVLMLRWGRRAGTNKARSQSRYVAFSLLITILLIHFYQQVFPGWLNAKLPSLLSIFVVIWFIGMWWAITRYRLLTLRSDIAANEILDNILDLVILTDQYGRIVEVNRQVPELIEHPKQGIEGRPVAELIVETEEFAPALDEVLSGRARRFGPTEYGVSVHTGGSVPVRLVGTGVTDRAGDVLGVVIAAQDLRQEKELERATEAKAHFLANMSHELRTPLNAVIGYSDLLEEEAEDIGANDLIPDLRRIQSAGTHLLSLVNDILDLSKVEAGRMEFEVERFDLDREIEGVVATAEPLMRKNANRLEVDTEFLGEILADATKIRQILLNLLSNAAKFTREGTVTLRARRYGAEGAEWIEIGVTDTGIGMSEDQLDKVFQAFTQANAAIARQYGGTGLGLAICHRFAVAMGGDIEPRSAPGEGSSFILRLPVEAPVAAY